MYKRLSRTVFLVIGIITILCLYLIPNLEFNYDFESFYPIEDTDRKFLAEHHERFGHDSKFMLVAVADKNGIFNQEFLQKVEALTDSIKTIEHIETVVSPTNIKQTIFGPLGPMSVPYLKCDKPETYAKDSVKIYQDQSLVGSLFSSDAKCVSLLATHNEKLTQEQTEAIIDRLYAILDGIGFDEYHSMGRVIAQGLYIKKLKQEMAIFILASLILVVAFLYVSFRSAWGILIPLAVVILSIIWILGFMSVMDKQIDLMLSLLPTIMFVVGMSDVVHITSKYLEELRNGKHKINAIKIAFKEVGVATLLTSITTAVGFLTLISSNIQPVRDFGIFTSIGVFLALFLALSLLPAVFLNAKKPRVAMGGNNKIFWHRQLRKIFKWLLRHTYRVVFIFVGIIAISIIGILQMEVNNYLLEDLSDDDPMKMDAVFLDKHFAGVRPFELSLQVSDTNKSMLDAEVIREIDKIESYVTNEYGVSYIFSPASVIKSVNQSLNNGRISDYKLPESDRELEKVVRKVKKYKRLNQIKSVVTTDGQYGRLFGKMKDVGSKKIRKLDKDLHHFMETEVDNNLITYRLTGSAMLIDKNNGSLAVNMVIGLGIAFIIIALIMGVLFKSLRMILISLVPNVCPLLMIAGIMGYLGVDLKASTSIIFTIAFGIAVDDTIHFMSKFKLELDKGKSKLYALKRTYISTGKAIAVTSLILCAGFMTLVLSDFQGTFYIGLLVGLTLLFALLSDLLLLPVLIFWYSRK